MVGRVTGGVLPPQVDNATDERATVVRITAPNRARLLADCRNLRRDLRLAVDMRSKNSAASLASRATRGLTVYTKKAAKLISSATNATTYAARYLSNVDFDARKMASLPTCEEALREISTSATHVGANAVHQAWNASAVCLIAPMYAAASDAGEVE